MAQFSTVVVGGGVTGLALAHRLLVVGGGKIGVTLLEAQPHTGGVRVHAYAVSDLLVCCAVLMCHTEYILGWVQSKFKDGVLMEEGPRSLRVAGNGATTLKLIQELNLVDQVLSAAPASKV